MKYLILDKKQRVENSNEGNVASANLRLIEELNKKNTPYSLAYFDELEFGFLNGETLIKVQGEDLRKYSHIIFRGHELHNDMQYHFKRYIIDYVDQYNVNNPDSKILVQNSKSIKKLPYYNKIALALFCSQNNIPYFNTYFRTDGKYLEQRDMLNEYPLIIKDYSGANRLENIEGKEKIKKNVFKIDNPKGYEQEYLKDLDLTRMFIQEFSDSAIDMRLFVKQGKVIAGWKRHASQGFMTVNHGIYSMYNVPDQEEKILAENVARILEADFIAVDIMLTNGKPLLQEISLHPGFKAYENKIKGEPVNIAEAIITSFSN